MKAIILFILFVHGFIHLLGFIKEWNLAPVSQISGATLFPSTPTTAHVIGALWLTGCILFLSAATIYLLHKEWWWIPALTAILISQSLIILYWKDARWGTVANVILLVAVVAGYAQWHFNKTVKTEVVQIFSDSIKNKPAVTTNDMLNGLPAPVQRWLTHCGIIGRDKIETVRLKQKGLMRTKPEQNNWIETEADQYVSINNPAFVWQVKMNMMSLPVAGRDKFVDGKGQMTIKLFSLVNIVNSADEKIDQGALQRYLSEICWYPSAALSPYIKWNTVDANSAKATMTYKGVSGSVLFNFNEQGDLVECSADRYMSNSKGASLERWYVQLKKYAEMNGIKIPVESEVTWKLKDGDFTWYKLRITNIEYNKPLLYSN